MTDSILMYDCEGDMIPIAVIKEGQTAEELIKQDLATWCCPPDNPVIAPCDHAPDAFEIQEEGDDYPMGYYSVVKTKI